MICQPPSVIPIPTPPPARIDLVRTSGLTRIVRKNGKHYAVHSRDQWICQLCGKDMLASLDAMMSITVDHVMPKGSGGGDNQGNLVTACAHCNRLKGDTPATSVEDARRIVAQRRAQLLQEVNAAMRERHLEFPSRSCLPWTKDNLDAAATLLAGQVAGIANAVEAIARLADAVDDGGRTRVDRAGD